MMDGLTIGRVAERAGVGVETIRFYQREGLVEEPPRQGSGYRRYPQDAVDRVRFIRRAKELGFTLREIGELLELRVDPDGRCEDVRERSLAKVRDIEGRIRTLERMRESLLRLARACSGSGTTGDCPILEALEAGGDDAEG